MSQWKKRLTACAIAGAVILAIPTAVFAVRTLLEPEPPSPAETVTISAANIKADAPAAGEVPRSVTMEGSGYADYTIDSFQWMESGKEVTGAFEAGKQYSVQVTLKANNYAALSAFKPTVSGAESVTSGTVNNQNPGNSLTFTAVFPRVPEGSTGPSPVQGDNYLSWQNGEIYLVAKFNDFENIMYNLGPKGPNKLFEIKKVNFVSVGLKGPEAIEDGGWNMMSSNTDCFGPYVLKAVNNPVAGTTQTFTGGNHGYLNTGDTSPGTKNTSTGKMVSLKIYADGQEISEGYSGYADEITFDWVNEVQGWNTKKPDGSGRAVLQEHYNMVFDGDTFHVSNEITFLEDCMVSIYYGLQLPNPWATDGIKYLNSANPNWNPVDTNNDCGDKTCSSFICKRGGYNCQVSIDSTVGIGDFKSLYGNDHPHSAFNSNYKKAYFHLWRDVPDVFTANSTYRFEGTYRFFYEE